MLATWFPRKAVATMPLVAVFGAALGLAVARESSVPATSAMTWFALALCFSSWATAVAEALIAQLLGIDPEGGAADALAFVLDGVFGIAVGLLVAKTASMHAFEAAGLASAVLFIQTLLFDKVVLKNAIGNTFVGLLHRTGGGTQRDYSYATTLAMRGDIAGARTWFEHEIARDPRNARAYLDFAHMLRMHARDYQGAAEVLERLLRSARPNPAMQDAVRRELNELRTYQLKKTVT